MRRSICLLVVLIFFVSGCASSTGSNTSQTTSGQPGSPPRATATLVPKATSNLPESSIPGIQLPTGFQISAYARGLNTPRFMTIGPNGVLLVATRGNNSVVALMPGSSPTRAASSRSSSSSTTAAVTANPPRRRWSGSSRKTPTSASCSRSFRSSAKNLGCWDPGP